jgi:hypothetical protein
MIMLILSPSLLVIFGNTTASNTLKSQLAIIYNIPTTALVIQTSGYVQMANRL